LHGGPANRWGSAVYTTAQLKTMQEVITLLVFVGFSILYLREPMTWNYAIGFALIAGGAYFIFRGPFSAALFWAAADHARIHVVTRLLAAQGELASRSHHAQLRILDKAMETGLRRLAVEGEREVAG
jgi:hypothetical protein